MKHITSLKFIAIFLLVQLFSISAKANVIVVATGGVLSATYPDFATTFIQINGGIHTGDITLYVVNNITETTTASLNASGVGLCFYNFVRIYPQGGSFTISGNIAAGSPLFDFNGADNVLIDGLNAGVNNLTITNLTASATSGTSTIRFINGATSNTITNCTVLGSSNSPIFTAGGTIFFSTDANTLNGNDNNTISNCNIGPAGSTLPTKAVNMLGTTTNATINNSNISIIDNRIYDYFSPTTSNAGIYVSSGNTDHTIQDNRFYQTSTRTQTTANEHAAIWISNTSGNNFSIIDNRVEGSNSLGLGNYTIVLASGSSSFVPIHILAGTTSATNINTNTIKSIAISGTASGISTNAPFKGIYINQGLVNSNINTIGSNIINNSITYTTNTTSSVDVYAMYNFGSSNWTTNNNIVGGISVNNTGTGAASFFGIVNFTSSSANWTASNNIIGGNFLGSIQNYSTASSCQLIALYNRAGNATITNNLVYNLTANGGTGIATTASLIGINNAGSAISNISKNHIYALANNHTTAATSITGIQISGALTGSKIFTNLIHELTPSSAAGIVNGIYVTSGTATYQNNMIRLGTNFLGSDNTIGFAINGINEASGTNNFYYNSIYIGSNNVTGSANSFAFTSVVINNTRKILNNIFYNARSNAATGTGKHYAIQVGGTTLNPTGLTINYNDYHVTGVGSFLGKYNGIDRLTISDWRTAVGQDINSFSGNPNFLNPTGSIGSLDLHINAAVPTPVSNTGIPIGTVSDDYDMEIRSLTNPDIGADEFAGIGCGQISIDSLRKYPDTTFCVAVDRLVTAKIYAGCDTIKSVKLKYRYNCSAETQVIMTGGNPNPNNTSYWVGTIPAATPADANVSWCVTVYYQNDSLTSCGNDYADYPIQQFDALATPQVICAGQNVNLIGSGISGVYDSLNYSEGFETWPPVGWSFTLVPPSVNLWQQDATPPAPRTGAHSMAYTSSNISPANAWAVTPGQTLTGGQCYTISFWYKVQSAAFPEKLKVTVGNGSSIANQTTVLWNNNGQISLNNINYAKATIIYTPTTDGIYYFGFNCYSDANMWNLYVDDVSITGRVLQPIASWVWTASNGGGGSTLISAQQNPGSFPISSTTNFSLTATNSKGCTETKSITVTVLPPIETHIYDTACDQYILNDSNATMVTSSGVYTRYLKSVITGCDSIVYLHLTINYSSSSTIGTTACDYYLWDVASGGTGNVYTTSGVYTSIIKNIAGCDSVITLNLIINNSTSTSLTVIACDSFYWHEIKYTTSGVYYFDTLNTAGCPEHQTLQLTINQSPHLYKTDTICNTALPYLWNGQQYNMTGDYIFIKPAVGSCDTIMHLKLFVKTCGKQCCPGINIIKNGDFEFGNNGDFSSAGYLYSPTAGLPGQYSVLTSAQANAIAPNSWNPDCNANNKHLIINGKNTGTAGKKIVWYQTLNLVKGVTYSFCADFKNLNQCGFNIKPKIDISFPSGATPMNSILIDSSGVGCDWQRVQKTFTWNGSISPAYIRISLDESGLGDGNDLAIDNIRLVALSSVPQSDLFFTVSITNNTGGSFNMSATPTAPLNGCTPYWKVEQIDNNNLPVSSTIVNNPNIWLPLNPNNFVGYKYNSTPVFSLFLASPGLFNSARRYQITYGRTCECNSFTTFSRIVTP